MGEVTPSSIAMRMSWQTKQGSGMSYLWAGPVCLGVINKTPECKYNAILFGFNNARTGVGLYDSLDSAKKGLFQRAVALFSPRPRTPRKPVWTEDEPRGPC